MLSSAWTDVDSDDNDAKACSMLRAFSVIAWVYYRAFINHESKRLGLALAAAYQKVHYSNLTKLCWSTEERDNSILKYRSKYDLPEDAISFDTCQSANVTYYVLRAARDLIFKKPEGDKFVPKGKFLKSTSFVEPVFDCPNLWSAKFNYEDCNYSIAPRWKRTL